MHIIVINCFSPSCLSRNFLRLEENSELSELKSSLTSWHDVTRTNTYSLKSTECIRYGRCVLQLQKMPVMCWVCCCMWISDKSADSGICGCSVRKPVKFKPSADITMMLIALQLFCYCATKGVNDLILLVACVVEHWQEVQLDKKNNFEQSLIEMCMFKLSV